MNLSRFSEPLHALVVLVGPCILCLCGLEVADGQEPPSCDNAPFRILDVDRVGDATVLTWYTELVDFESGFGEGDTVGAVPTAWNEVKFQTLDGLETFAVEVGSPQVAFHPQDQPAGGNPGRFFLSDETGGSTVAKDYLMTFVAPVLSLGLDLYDFRQDLPALAGATATLTAYGNEARTFPVGSDSVSLTETIDPDGVVHRLRVSNPAAPIVAATVTFSAADTGTGIDNLRFTTAGAEDCCVQWLLLRDGEEIATLPGDSTSITLETCEPGDYCIQCLDANQNLTAPLCVDVTELHCGAREACAGPTFDPTADAFRFGPVTVIPSVRADGTPTPLVLEDIGLGGEFLKFPEPWEESFPVMGKLDFDAACGSGGLPRRVVITAHRPGYLADLPFVFADGALIWSGSLGGTSPGVVEATLESTRGISTIQILRPPPFWIEKICWSCDAQPLEVTAEVESLQLPVCGDERELSIRVDSPDPIGGVQLGVAWNPADAIEVVEVLPGRGLPVVGLNSFFANVESAAVGLSEGQATMGWLLDADAVLPPGRDIEVFRILVRPGPTAEPSSAAQLCVENGLGQPPLVASLAVVRDGEIISEPLPETCGAVGFVNDLDPPTIRCPDELIVDGSAGTANGVEVQYDVSTSDDCGPVTLECDPPSGSMFPVGSTTVSCTAIDGAGRTATCSFEVLVTAPTFRRADNNEDGIVDIADALNLVFHLFLSEEHISCLSAGDANDDGVVDVADVMKVLTYLFLRAPAPPAPFSVCGVDPTPDGLQCGTHAECPPPPIQAASLHQFLARVPFEGGDIPGGGYTELARSQQISRKHLIYAFDRTAQASALLGSSWNGAFLLRDPSLTGKPLDVAGSTWYEQEDGRLARPLLGSQGQTVGVLGVGFDRILIALDIGADGVADVVDILDAGGHELLMIDPRAGGIFINDDVVLCESFGNLVTDQLLDQALATLGSGSLFASGDTPLIFQVIDTLRSAADPDAPSDLPDLDLPLPFDSPFAGQSAADILDLPAIESFEAVEPTCTVEYDATRPLLSYRALPGSGGTPIQRVRITAVNLDGSSQTIFELAAPPDAPWTEAVGFGIPDPRPDGRFTSAYVLRAWNVRGFATRRRLPFSYLEPPEFEIQGVLEEIPDATGWTYRLPVTRAVGVGRICILGEGLASTVRHCFLDPVIEDGVFTFHGRVQLSARTRTVLVEAANAGVCPCPVIVHQAVMHRLEPSAGWTPCGIRPVVDIAPSPFAVTFLPLFPGGTQRRDRVHFYLFSTANEPRSVDVFLSTDSGFSRRFEDVEIPRGPLVNTLLSTEIGPGASRYTVVVDPGNLIDECDDENNVMTCTWDGDVSRWDCEVSGD